MSMTGYGKGSASTPSRTITIEIKSLNSKQFDFTMRAPSYFKELEVESRNVIAASLERGKVEASASLEQAPAAEATATLNLPLLKMYKANLELMSQELGIDPPQDWYTTLLRMPDAMKAEPIRLEADDNQAWHQALEQALHNINEFRRAEGARLYKFFVEKVTNIGRLLQEIDPFESERITKIRTRLEENLSSLTSIEYDKGRLEQELIFYIEKLDVSEEKLRLRTHLHYFLETMGAEDAPRAESGQGKKLGFIAQEIGREINTLGSKSNNADMQKIVVRMKDELEQIKEQVLNVL